MPAARTLPDPPHRERTAVPALVVIAALAGLVVLAGRAGQSAPDPALGPEHGALTVAPLAATAPRTLDEAIALPAQVAVSWQIVREDADAGELAMAGTDARFLADDLRAYALRALAAIDPSSDAYLGEPAPKDAGAAARVAAAARHAAHAADRAARRCEMTDPVATAPACTRAMRQLSRAMRALPVGSGEGE